MAELRTVSSSTIRTHKHQFIWQILVPFLVMAVLIVTAAVLVVSGGVSQTRTWADVSIIWILAPMMVMALVMAIILGAIIYGFARLLPLIPRFTGRAQQITASVAAGTHKVAMGVTNPILWLQKTGLTIRSFLKKR